MIKYPLLSALTLSFICSFAQRPANYEDVAVIVNTNSNNSVAIANYFKTARNIPDRNMIYITGDTVEEINSVEFSSLRAQIEQYLIDSQLVDRINYLVTTKGVPLRVKYGGGLLNPDPRNAAVDAELRIILNPGLSSLIGVSNPVINPYYLARDYFSRDKYGIYLVTRLTGYSVNTVQRMIDSSGPNIPIKKANAKFILDGQVVASGLGSSIHNTTSLVSARNILQSRGWNVIFNQTNTYIKNENNVLGYWSWGSNTPGISGFNAIPNNNWLKGALAETGVSSSGRAYYPCDGGGGVICYGQSKMGDWLEEGCSGVSSFVYEPFSAAIAYPGSMMDYFTDEDYVFNLAEIYHMASWLPVSWMQTIVGDPKSSIYGFTPQVPNPSVTVLLDSIDQSNNNVSGCKDESIQLVAYNWSPGNSNWFMGNTASVMANGSTYTSVHPDFVASGDTFGLDSTFMSGNYVFTYINENIAGISMKEVNLVIHNNPAIPTISRGGDVLVSSQTVGTFQWGQYNIVDNEFNPIPNANNSSFIPPIPAVYNVEYTDTNGCKSTSDGYNFTSFTGIAGLNKLIIMPNIYPNPSSGLLNIDLKTNDNIFEITISNLLGKTVFNQKTNKQQLLKLNISKFSNGLYNISYWGVNNNLLTKQNFIISK